MRGVREVSFPLVSLLENHLLHGASGDQPMPFFQEHSSQHMYQDVCTTQEQNAQSTIRKKWRKGGFGRGGSFIMRRSGNGLILSTD